MSAPNLTRDQAVERAARRVAVQNYRIELDLTDQPARSGVRGVGHLRIEDHCQFHRHPWREHLH